MWCRAPAKSRVEWECQRGQSLPPTAWIPDNHRDIRDDLIYTVRIRPHTSVKSPSGLNALWGDGHVSFNTTQEAFDPKLRDPLADAASLQNRGDNATKFRTIVSLLKP